MYTVVCLMYDVANKITHTNPFRVTDTVVENAFAASDPYVSVSQSSSPLTVPCASAELFRTVDFDSDIQAFAFRRADLLLAVVLPCPHLDLKNPSCYKNQRQYPKPTVLTATTKIFCQHTIRVISL